MTALGMDGIAPDGTRILLCGLSYRQITSCAGMNQLQAAEKLGVSIAHFRRVIHKLGMSHWMEDTHRPRPLCLSADDISQLAAEGYTQKDAAHIAGVSYNYFKALVGRYKLNHLFPRNGHAQAISRKGYCQ